MDTLKSGDLLRR